MLPKNFSQLILFIDSISIVAALCIILSISCLLGNWKKQINFRNTAKINRIGKTKNSILSFVSVFLWIRLLSLPLFYLALQSVVDNVKGAMCIYGVTRLSPHLYVFLATVKPLAFFLIGLWLTFHSITNESESRPLILKKLILLLVVNICIMANSLGDFLFFLCADFNTPVTCCTVNIDLPNRISAILSEYLFGRLYKEPLLLFYYLGNLALISIAGYFLQKAGKKRESIHRSKLIGFVSIMGLADIFFTWLTLQEAICPRLMKLPYHHCLYCLLQYVPDSCFIVSLPILGTFGFGWAFGLKIMTGDDYPCVNLPGYIAKLYRFSILCLTLSLVMVSIHLSLS